MKRFLLMVLFLGVAFHVSGANTKLHCATNDFAPYGFEENGQLKGIEVELIQEIAQRLDIQIEVEMLPWKRILRSMEVGAIDCMFAAFRTEERLVYMDYTNVPIHVSSLVFYVHKENPIRFKTMADLKDLTIGLVDGFTTSPDFDKAFQQKLFTIQGSKDVQASFQMLDRERVDTVLFNRHVGAYALKQEGLTSIVPLPTPLTATSAYLTFSKKNNLSHLVPHFDSVLFELLTDGTYSEIFQKYTGIASP